MKKSILLLCILMMAFTLIACTNNEAASEATYQYPSDRLEEGQSFFTLKDNGAILSFKSYFPDGLSSDEFKKALKEQFLTSDDVTLLNYEAKDKMAAFDFEFNSIEAIRKTAILMSKDTVVNVAAILQEQSEDQTDGFEIMTSKGVLYHFDEKQDVVTAEALKAVQDKTIVQIQGSENACYSVPGKILMTNKNVEMMDEKTFKNIDEKVLIVIYENEN